MKINKWVLGGAIGAVVVGATMYVTKQVKKIKDYKISFNRIKVNKFTLDTLNFNAFYNYQNNSDIDIKLASQQYDVYVNGTFATSMVNNEENTLKANAVSELGFNVNLNLPELDKKLKVNYFKMVADPKEVKIRIDMNFKIRVGFFKVPIKYTWNTDLKQILGWYLPMYR